MRRSLHEEAEAGGGKGRCSQSKQKELRVSFYPESLITFSYVWKYATVDQPAATFSPNTPSSSLSPRFSPLPFLSVPPPPWAESRLYSHTGIYDLLMGMDGAKAKSTSMLKSCKRNKLWLTDLKTSFHVSAPTMMTMHFRISVTTAGTQSCVNCMLATKPKLHILFSVNSFAPSTPSPPSLKLVPCWWDDDVLLSLCVRGKEC